MKKLLFAVVLLSATSVYSQEIRVPDEKREQYVKERENKAVLSEEDQKAREEAYRKRKEEALRQQEGRPANTVKEIYCIIQEISVPTKPGKAQVNILRSSNYEEQLKNLDLRKQPNMKETIVNDDYVSGMDALNRYIQLGWTLEHTTVYTSGDQTVREYLMKL